LRPSWRGAVRFDLLAQDNSMTRPVLLMPGLLHLRCLASKQPNKKKESKKSDNSSGPTANNNDDPADKDAELAKVGFIILQDFVVDQPKRTQAMDFVRDKLKVTTDRLEAKLASLRSAGADASMLEILNVESSSGQRIPLKNLGTVAVTSPREMVVHVHDPSLLGDVERAIMTSGLNLVPQADKAKCTIRVPIPKTTKDQRDARIKLAGEMTESSKLELRRTRQDVQKKLKSVGLPKDDLERAEKKLQVIVDSGNDKLSGLFKKKEKELAGGE